ncbi:hypothetical protein [Micromonospora sp. WMMD980]|uniref:hypothetical protein n=1 Tax=Micromonospora sp. WMMD980 TaxID=3016088 RepID=UPI002416AC30|nr:hypothetical protein [Micromonospora sp. WMMD980]MDG4801045.1 hypothetical protein [Micromonospora sp. WMMD980]
MAWARRENELRRRAYETAARDWRRRADHLDRLRIEADGFHGCDLPGGALPAPLDDGEVVYRILPVAELVEAAARHLAGLPAPGRTLAGHLEPGDGTLPAGLRVVDTGAAVVTDRRVTFAGRDGRRDWALGDLLAPGHHPDRPVTLLHRADGTPPSGLRMPAAGAANARFYLTLAHADATGSRDAVAADVEALRAAHRAARPRPPRPLGPGDAPPDRVPSGRLVAAGVAMAAVLLGVTSAGTWPATAGPNQPAALAAVPTPAGTDGGIAPTPSGSPIGRRASDDPRPPRALPRPNRAPARTAPAGGAGRNGPPAAGPDGSGLPTARPGRTAPPAGHDRSSAPTPPPAAPTAPAPSQVPPSPAAPSPTVDPSATAGLSPPPVSGPTAGTGPAGPGRLAESGAGRGLSAGAAPVRTAAG